MVVPSESSSESQSESYSESLGEPEKAAPTSRSKEDFSLVEEAAPTSRSKEDSSLVGEAAPSQPDGSVNSVDAVVALESYMGSRDVLLHRIHSEGYATEDACIDVNYGEPLRTLKELPDSMRYGCEYHRIAIANPNHRGINL